MAKNGHAFVDLCVFGLGISKEVLHMLYFDLYGGDILCNVFVFRRKKKKKASSGAQEKRQTN